MHGVAARQFEEYRRRKRFASLDGLRCVAIIAVVWSHAVGDKPPMPLLGNGYVGVDLFFLISGYLITTLLIRERETTGTISLSRFYARRTLRIFPLYYTVVLTYLVIVLLTERHTAAGRDYVSNLPYFLTYSSNWFVTLTDHSVVFYFAWSLATQEQFYTVWPLIERCGRRLHLPVIMSVVLIVLAVTVYDSPVGNLVIGDGFVRAVLARIPVAICLGVLLAHGLQNARGYRLARHLVGGWWASAVLLVAAGFGQFAPWGEVWVTILLLMLVASCVVREDHVLAPVLTWRPAVWVGTISYGIYLLHMLAVDTSRHVLGAFGVRHPEAVFALALPLVIGAASVSYRWYESIFLRMKPREPLVHRTSGPRIPAHRAGKMPARQAAPRVLVPPPPVRRPVPEPMWELIPPLDERPTLFLLPDKPG